MNWNTMGSAPLDATEVRVVMKDGTVHERAHWACDLSGEEQPAFRGWFVPSTDSSGRVDGYVGIAEPVGWQSLTPMLVGELNPYGPDASMALYPVPRGAAGDRMREILGMTDQEYLRAFDRQNLCTGTWSRRSAVARAGELLAQRRSLYVLLGRRVADAFLPPPRREMFALVEQRYGDWAARLLLLPHPSGRCRLWNEPGAAESARRLLEEARRCR